MTYTIRTFQESDLEAYFRHGLQEEEGELYIVLMLLKYMTGYLKKGGKTTGLGGIDRKSETIPFRNLIPKGWTYKRAYLYLYEIFLCLEADIKVTFYKKELLKYYKGETYDYHNPLFERFYNQGETNLIFQDRYFCLMEDEIFDYVEIVNDFDTEENISELMEFIDMMMGRFIGGVLSKRYSLISHEKQRNMVLNKIADFHSLVGGIFKVEEKHFQKQKISLMFVMVLLWKLKYIYIIDFHCLDDIPQFDEQGKYAGEKESLHFDILITSKAGELFDGLFEMRNMILDAVFDEEYKKISIIRKGGELHMLERDLEVPGDETLFVKLRDQYPYSEINAKNYKGKTTKYEIKERIKLSK